METVKCPKCGKPLSLELGTYYCHWCKLIIDPSVLQPKQEEQMANEKRLIDANALKSKLQEHKDFFVNSWGGYQKMSFATKCRVDEIDNCIAEIVNAHMVEAVPVVHGRWIEKQEPLPWCEDDVEVYTVCSVCESYSPGESNYCPNCGALMDLKGETNEG